jgi:protein-S-isoprenylcysteine O-methyltransferase Ste14
MRPDAAARQPTQAPRFWIVFGWSAHGLFAVTVYYLFFYLKGPNEPPDVTSLRAAAIDVALALQFAVFHSALLLPEVRRRLTRFIPSPAYGVFFCVATCVSLLAAIFAWQPWGGVVWHLTGWAGTLVEVGFYASWFGMFYSLYYSGFGYQTGWTTWRPWSQGRKIPVRDFQPRGPFKILRHPVYFSFLGLIWFAPCMTYDRAALTAVWTVYIFYGSYLKDRRLLHYLGDRYRYYQSQVPGYPGIPYGPMARISWSPTSDSSGLAT